MLSLVILPLVVFTGLVSSQERTVTIFNDRWRFDTNGSIINAHDGQLVSFDGGQTYLLYGTAYAYCTQHSAVCDGVCGYLNNTFAVLSSPDLMVWTLHSANILPAMVLDNTHINYWEANVGYNQRTGRYVMTYWSSRYGFVNNMVAAASASSPMGPFTNEAPIALQSAKIISDTVNLFVDDDNTAYLRVNTRDAPLRHTIERLAPDWLSSTGQYSVIFEKQDFPWYDGGGVVKHAGRYFVMLSFDCCFCQWGSDALVFVATSPIGTWLPQPRVARPRSPFPSIGTVLGASTGRGLSLGGDPRSALCNLNGSWSGVLGGQTLPDVPNVVLLQAAGSPDVTIFVDGQATVFAVGTVYANGSIVIPQFPGHGLLEGLLGPAEGAPDPCARISWVDYSPPGSYWCRYPQCRAEANWTNEVNYCADGAMPPASVPNMFFNPCSLDNIGGTNFTIPAQQFNIATLYTPTGTQVMYFGEQFRSSPDGIKPHDYQAWIPIEFSADNTMLPMRWAAQWNVTLGVQPLRSVYLQAHGP
eukprot:m.23481 g.23481  ORF g.23481 m.23481 type:complete len:528 (-) comp3908_c0_seq1:135-1718(-)